ncbi:Hypothetical predicted protein [Mytilus galloprovincialis]|uniref:Uncharacterized protein n=1 Tax=Mytilus galloprovincialis TaxID=29158 RepID=A0A8B6CGY7_MYTGA|nr:Hypothetical predicted protein [Mytilus galloprovincialis]
MDIADEYFNLLDYNEEDLDTDLAAIQNQEVAQTTEFEVATQVVAEDMENHDDQDDSIEKIEFFFTTGGVMKCPIEGCTAGRFTSKWFLIFKGRTIKSVPSTASSTSSCPPVQSNTNTSSIATTNTTTTSTAVSNSIPTVPYFSSLIAATTNTSVYQEEPQTTVTVPSKNPSSNIISLQDYRHRENAPSIATASDIIIIDYNTSFGIAANSQFTDGSCQTSSLELQPLVLPPIPQAKEELEGYIRWLCLGIDQFSRQKRSC